MNLNGNRYIGGSGTDHSVVVSEITEAHSSRSFRRDPGESTILQLTVDRVLEEIEGIGWERFDTVVPFLPPSASWVGRPLG
jgi:hypothetical protein